jgi:hypothetical protein
MPIHIPAVWRIKVQPRVHVFLCCLLITSCCLEIIWLRDSMSLILDACENESVTHLFCECAVAKEMWCQLSMLTGIKLQVNLFSVSSLWICEKTNQVPNIVHAAALWSLWKLRNDLCFNRSSWSCMQVLYLRVVHTLGVLESVVPGRKKKRARRSLCCSDGAGASSSPSDLAET